MKMSNYKSLNSRRHCSLEKKASILYEQLNHKRVRTVYFALSDMRNLLLADTTKYPMYGSFKRYLLAPAICLINDHTDKTVAIKEEVKQCGKVIGVVISVKKKPATRKPTPQTLTTIRENILLSLDLLDSSKFKKSLDSIVSHAGELKSIIEKAKSSGFLESCHTYAEGLVDSYENPDSKYGYDLQDLADKLEESDGVLQNLPDCDGILDGVNAFKDEVSSIIENIEQLLHEAKRGVKNK